MLEAIALLLFCQLIGELIVVGLSLPLPGPVIGMMMLFAGLLIVGELPENLARVSQGLLDQLSLLFVPAGVGVMTHLGMLGTQWLPLSASLVISSLLTLAITGWLMQYLVRLSDSGASSAVESSQQAETASPDVGEQKQRDDE